MNAKPAVLSIVIPCYNESETLLQTAKRITALLAKLIKAGEAGEKSFVLFVDDGSEDNTWEMINRAAAEFKNVKGLKLSKNYGHQYALLAGLEAVKGKCCCCITIDADLQQDENAISDFLKEYYSGKEIVFGVRKNRNTDSLFKKIIVAFFYNFMNFMGEKVIKGHSEYRLLSNRVLESLSGYTETNLFLRGLFPNMGYKTGIVYHDVCERALGKSKYNFKKMFSLALDATTSFSILPIRLITILGFITFIVSIMMSLYVLVVYIFYRNTVVLGWMSTTLPLYFLCGVQLLSIGIIGEYISKIYMEVKRRPRYLIEETKNFQTGDEV